MKNGNNEILNELIHQLSDSDADARRLAAEELGDMKETESVKALVERLSVEKNLGTLEAISDALVNIGQEESVKSLLHLLSSEDTKVRNTVCEILAKIGKQALDLIITELKNDSRDVRKFAADILGAIGDPKAIEALIESIDDGSVNTSCAAIESLGSIGDIKAIPTLLEVVKGSNADNTYYAIIALSQIKDPSPTKILRPLLTSKHPPSI